MHSMILHVDGDAFFASVHQATHPQTKGKPVVIGKDRSIATAFSYEAKRMGVKRGMLISEVRKVCPQCIIATSSYQTYESFSRKMISIAQSYSPDVERYSIDEFFVDMSKIPPSLVIDYETIGRTIKAKIEKSLDITVSAGIGRTKSLAKIASSFYKPSGFAIIEDPEKPGSKFYELLGQTDIEDVWGIGWRTAPKMKGLKINTALDFYSKPYEYVSSTFNKPIIEIWHELHGKQIFPLDALAKTTYKSIRKSSTSTPAINDKSILFARLSGHIERAFAKARRLNYKVGRISIFLKTQKFTYSTIEIKCQQKIQFPFLIRKEIRTAFNEIFKLNILYRATGCTLYDFEDINESQACLFNFNEGIEKRLKNIYPLFEGRYVDFGNSLFEKKRKEKKHFYSPVLEEIL